MSRMSCYNTQYSFNCDSILFTPLCNKCFVINATNILEKTYSFYVKNTSYLGVNLCEI